MNLVEDTLNLTNEMFKKGANNNEQLKLLLSNLREILESNNEELQISKNRDEFVITFLSKLVNLYKPTNSSQYPSKIIEIHDENEKQITDIEQSFLEVSEDTKRFALIVKNAVFAREDAAIFNELIDLNETRIYDKCQMLREKICLSNYKIRRMTEQLLIDCRY
jgi:hypothetical protein